MNELLTIDDYKEKSFNYIINKKKKALISVITICKNSEKTIEKTLNSLKNQTSKNFEYIIIDGNSSDKTVEIIKNNQNIVDKLISEDDNSTADALNKGISISEGELIFWLASDDWIDSNIIRIFEENYNKNKDNSFYYGNMIMYYEDNIKTIYPKKKFSEKILKGVPEFCYPAVLFKKKLFIENGLFSTSIKINNDFEFFLRILKKNLKFKYIENFNVNRLTGGIGEKEKFKNLYETLKINLYYKTVSLVFIKFFIKNILYFSIIFLKDNYLNRSLKLYIKKFFYFSQKINKND